MPSVPGSDSLAWSDEQTRLYLQLRIEEKLKGNVRKQMVNEAGRQAIIDKFYEVYGERHTWRKFGIKYNTCKKQFESFKRLIRNRTGLGYHADGSIDMSEDWWNEHCKEWPGARKLKEKPVPNTDLMENIFGTVHITGGEGWAAQQGKENLDAKTMHHDHDSDDDLPPTQEPERATDSRFIPPTQETERVADSIHIHTQETESRNVDGAAESRNVGPSSSSRKISRVVQAGQAVADVIRDSIQSRDKILEHKNKLIENHPEFSCSQFRAMQVLHSLSAIGMWSPLYKAAIIHLKQDPANRQTFLCYEEDKTKFSI